MSKVIKFNEIRSEKAVGNQKEETINLAMEELLPSVTLALLSNNIDDETFKRRIEIIRDVYSRPKFYTIQDVAEMTGLSYGRTAEVFNSIGFPSCDFGKNKIVEASALHQYFQERRCNNNPKYIANVG